jgi:hypothetical protein
MEKWIAAGLQAGGAFLFAMAGGASEVVLLLPAAASGIAGLVLWGRASRPVLPPPPPAPALEAQVKRVEDLLLDLHADVAQLREDREFFRELYSEQMKRPELKA